MGDRRILDEIDKGRPERSLPCGSGRKYKRCCEGKATNSTSSSTATPALTGGKFRFEPGSNGDKGTFAASISCLKQVRPDEWVTRAIFAWQRRCARRLGAADPRTGGVTAVQRFGSALNLNVHRVGRGSAAMPCARRWRCSASRRVRRDSWCTKARQRVVPEAPEPVPSPDPQVGIPTPSALWYGLVLTVPFACVDCTRA